VSGSGAKASFGALKGVVADVTHGDSAPLAVVVQPAGSAGATTPSKVWEKAVVVTNVPSVKLKTAFPRSFAPSWRWIVAVRVPPQVPVAVKVNGMQTVAPGAIAP